MSLRATALRILQMSHPQQKCAALALINVVDVLDVEQTFDEPAKLPGRPDQPELVNAMQVQRRSMATPEGRAALIHALAHIELNAVNLALDAIWRFANMPPQYYLDWLSVAKDEARHFTLLDQHLNNQSFQYGDFSAHNGLWDMAELTKHDICARMALVPRTLEARGLDASPQVRHKLVSAGDARGGEIVTTILNDEIGHVYIGNYWYNYLCQIKSIDPIQTYALLAAQYKAPKLIAPLNLEARKASGFSEQEIKMMVDAVAR
jgi:uncharacterized ferritin-like protein (DUF455 family)